MFIYVVVYLQINSVLGWNTIQGFTGKVVKFQRWDITKDKLYVNWNKSLGAPAPTPYGEGYKRNMWGEKATLYCKVSSHTSPKLTTSPDVQVTRPHVEPQGGGSVRRHRGSGGLRGTCPGELRPLHGPRAHARRRHGARATAAPRWRRPHPLRPLRPALYRVGPGRRLRRVRQHRHGLRRPRLSGEREDPGPAHRGRVQGDGRGSRDLQLAAAHGARARDDGAPHGGQGGDRGLHAGHSSARHLPHHAHLLWGLLRHVQARHLRWEELWLVWVLLLL